MASTALFDIDKPIPKAKPYPFKKHIAKSPLPRRPPRKPSPEPEYHRSSERSRSPTLHRDSPDQQPQLGISWGVRPLPRPGSARDVLTRMLELEACNLSINQQPVPSTDCKGVFFTLDLEDYRAANAVRRLTDAEALERIEEEPHT